MRPRRRGPVGRGRAILFVLLAPLLAGCTEDPTPRAAPISLLDAYGPALADARAHDETASLIAFVGFEGPRPTHLSGLLAETAPQNDATADADRADGRVHEWSLVFATRTGDLLTTRVVAAPFAVETDTLVPPADLPVATLWALNLGGRLLVDTPAALQTFRDGDPEAAAYLARERATNVLYSSALAPAGYAAGQDLVHHIEIGYGQTGSAPFARFGDVSHFSGDLVATGDAKEHREAHTVTLVDETFTLDPRASEIVAYRKLLTTVQQATTDLRVSGQGLYAVELVQDNRTMLARFEGHVLSDPAAFQEALGTLPPGDYGLRAEAKGVVTFELRVTGLVMA